MKYSQDVHQQESLPVPKGPEPLLLQVFLRAGAILTLGVLCFVIPEVGPNRFLLGSILILLIAPLAAVLELRWPFTRLGPTQPIFDITAAITLVHLAPEAWIPALIAGALNANSTSVHLCKNAFLVYPSLNIVLVGGMVFSAVRYQIHDWHLPILTYLACLPSLIFYLHWNIRRSNELRDRTQRLQNMALLAGGVAHDFNNILTGIVGYAELARAALPEDHSANRSIGILLQGTQRAKLLTGQLLTFAGREIRSVTEVNLDEEIRSLILLLESVVPRGVHIDLVTGNRPVYAQGDRSQLQQVFMNLLVNAAESMAHRSGTIRIELRAEEQSPLAGKPAAVCEIKDEGCGIAPSDLGRICEPFFSSKANGHGLGLACTSRIIQEHHGEIAISSTVNKGTTVCVRLPLASGTQHRPVSAIDSPQRSAHRRVLVVDDDENIRDVFRLMLRQLGYDVITAESGEQAVTLLLDRDLILDFVLLDLKMPGMTGWECREELRRLRPELPVIIASGYDPSPEHRIENAPDVFLRKPFTLQSLKLAVEAVLEADSCAGIAKKYDTAMEVNAAV
ncbi:MAG: ATP-binding protein [Planctomycetaceae bacterium]